MSDQPQPNFSVAISIEVTELPYFPGQTEVRFCTTIEGIAADHTDALTKAVGKLPGFLEHGGIA